jgi:hypothetical protein
METTTAMLERESRLIDGLRALVERYVGDKDQGRAEDAITSMGARLRERIHLEETVLFPAVERLIGNARTMRLRKQHAVLLGLVAEIERSLLDGAFDAATGDLRELAAALKAHLDEERKVLLPIIGADASGVA